MGASESLAEEFQVVEDFNSFVNLAKGSGKSNLLSTLNPHINKLKEKSEKFFDTYSRLKDSNKIGGEGIDLNDYFQKIVLSIEAFKECVQYIKKNSRKDEIATVSANFRNDLRKFIKQLTQLASTVTGVLEELITKVTPSLMSEFYFELNIFDFALNISKIDKPPYYSMSTSPAYELRDHIYDIESQNINVTAPHAAGKTMLVPLFLAGRLLKNSRSLRFIIVVEHETSLIRQIKNTYRQICYKDLADSYDYDEDNDSLYITSSLARISSLIDSHPFYPVVGILSPLDTLRLTRIVGNIQDLVSKSVFVIDDIHMRTVETDVLAQDLHSSILKLKKGKNDPHIVLMSTVNDDRFLKFIGRHEDLSVENLNAEVGKREVRCNSIDSVTKRHLFKEMHDFFSRWMVDLAVSIGSVIVFVPSDKDGQRVHREIFKFYSKDNATNICPLKATIRKGESPDDFYARLLGEITIAESTRPEGTQILFLMPVFLSSEPTPEDIALLHSQLPVPFIDKVARVFITTIKNEPQLQISDLMIIFDTGIEEVEFYDPKLSAFRIKKQLLPQPFMQQHRKMLGGFGDGFYFEFIVNGAERPDSLVPSVRRNDLGRQLMILRSFGVKLEEQRNLPNEPDHDILDRCFESLRQMGVIDTSDDKGLTALGKEAAKFASVSPYFAVATAKYADNRQFAFLCSLIIENSRTLVTDPKSKLLCKHFCGESDVVTLLESIGEVSEGGPEAFEESGLSIGAVYAMYTQIENTFEGVNGRNSVVNAVKWSHGQAGGTLGAVDRFVSMIDKEAFLDKRRCKFMHVQGAGPGNEPTLVYSANDVFKFSRSKKGEEEGGEANIKFARRPGWLGLQSPGSIIVLSVIIEEESKLNRGLIIHRDPSSTTPGVVSQKVDNISLNSFFFVSLFEAYWSGRSTVNEFIGIYHTPTPKKESAFLIHMTESDGKTYLNYCPRTTDVENMMREAIPILSSLMQFVPRSIIAKVDTPICAIEVVGYGACNQYTTHIHLIQEPDTDLPFAYPINSSTLKYAANNLNYLKKTLPLIRFAVTGESFYYKSIRGREVEADLTYPDVSPSIKSVFDPAHSSHLVLIVDKSFPNKPPVQPLPWLPTGGAPIEPDTTDSEDNKLMVDVASKIMDGLGYAERSADLFYITLGGGFPTAGHGEVPEAIRTRVGFSAAEGGAIKFGMYPLIRHFLEEFTHKQKLTEEIPLKMISSTNAWRNYPTDEGTREGLCDRISKAVASHFHVKEENSQASFLGHSMLVIRVVGIAENLVTHRLKSDVWDDTYQPCQADTEVINVLRSLGVDFQITQVIHVPSISVCVRHMNRFVLSEEDFTKKVTEIAGMFGFLQSAQSEYLPPADLKEETMGVLGSIDIELVGMSSGIVCATLLSSEFKIKKKDDFSITCTMATCLGMATIKPGLGDVPKVGLMDRAIKVTPAEIEALKELVAMKNKGKKKKKAWNLDTNFNILIIPATDEAAAQEMMKQVRDKEEDTTCQFICEPPQVFLPQSLYCFSKDGSVKAIAICKECMVEHFRAMDELAAVMDPVTHLIDRRQLSKLDTNLPGFAFVADDAEVDSEIWPQIPLGQGVWALMSAPDELGPYVKAWFTAIIDFIVRKARNYFTFCPNHPDIPHRTPKPGHKFKCPYCNMIYCDTCMRWHSLDERCGPRDPNMKYCPNCHVPTFKFTGCNHITCPCGKHWCYKCTPTSPIFNTSTECYAHLTAVHGGYST